MALDIYFLKMLCSGPKGNSVILSTVPSSLMTKTSCSRYPPAPSWPSGMVTMGSIDTTMPGSSTVSMSSRSSRPVQTNNVVKFYSVLHYLILTKHFDGIKYSTFSTIHILLFRVGVGDHTSWLTIIVCDCVLIIAIMMINNL